MADSPETLTVHYIKSNFFRVIHADGVYGGVGPTGKINISFYNDRHPIPQSADFDVLPGPGTSAKLINERRHGREGVVREIEANVVIDYDLAVSLRRWLDDKIAEVDKLKAQNQ